MKWACFSSRNLDETKAKIDRLLAKNVEFAPLILPPERVCFLIYYKDIPIRHWDGKFEIAYAE